jgi:hypothetical protein
MCSTGARLLFRAIALINELSRIVRSNDDGFDQSAPLSNQDGSAKNAYNGFSQNCLGEGCVTSATLEIGMRTTA